MSPAAALAQVRRLFVGLDGDALQLAAGLLDAVEAARDVLASAADDDSPAGIAARAAHEILADAAAEAAPPAAEPDPRADFRNWTPASRNGGAALLAGALALKP